MCSGQESAYVKHTYEPETGSAEVEGHKLVTDFREGSWSTQRMRLVPPFRRERRHGAHWIVLYLVYDIQIRLPFQSRAMEAQPPRLICAATVYSSFAHPPSFKMKFRCPSDAIQKLIIVLA